MSKKNKREFFLTSVEPRMANRKVRMNASMKKKRPGNVDSQWMMVKETRGDTEAELTKREKALKKRQKTNQRETAFKIEMKKIENEKQKKKKKKQE